MNEYLFVLHIIFIFLATLGALRLGKTALSTWVCLQALFANLFVLKQITLFGFHVTASDVFAVGGILGLNLIQEFYGKKEAKKATTTCLYCLLLFAVLSKIHLLYKPSFMDENHPSYQAILDPAPRLFIASLITFYLVQKIDIKLFSKLKSSMSNSPFALRNLISLCTSQFLDTILFTFLGLYGMVFSFYDVIFVSFLTKVIVIAFLTPASLLAKKWITPKESFV
ncbi:MAG: queuosine precursor transporter [Verrucomicrobia bacterium]|nr:queuosine precursor transporter [Verrucomicrobiota bacterium]